MNARVAPTLADAASPHLRPMREDDIDPVHAIEIRAYEFPWTPGIFRDCLRAAHPSWVLVESDAVVGYVLMSVAAGEAHILNVCVAPAERGRGLGKRLVRTMLQLARARRVERVFLEVRPSNPGAIALYEAEGFNEIGRRPRYYPARSGREDGLVMAMELFPGD